LGAPRPAWDFLAGDEGVPSGVNAALFQGSGVIVGKIHG
jgi:hypothetical protein